MPTVNKNIPSIAIPIFNDKGLMNPQWYAFFLTIGIDASTIGVTSGGTGLSSYTQGDMLYASATNVLAKLAKNTSATRYLSNTGTSNNPAWAQVDLSTGVTGNLGTSHLNGGSGAGNTVYWRGDGVWSQVSLSSDVNSTLPVANGGTGKTSVTSYAVLCGGTTSTGDFQSIASVGTSGQVLTSNGAGALPTFQNVSSGTGTTGFSAYLAANANNVTGNGTLYTIIADTENYDISSDYNTGTGTFTTPTTGKYLIWWQVFAGGLTASHTAATLEFTASIGYVYSMNIGAIRNASTNQTLIVGSKVVQLSASDTVNMKIQVSNGGSDDVDIIGGLGNTAWGIFRLS